MYLYEGAMLYCGHFYGRLKFLPQNPIKNRLDSGKREIDFRETPQYIPEDKKLAAARMGISASSAHASLMRGTTNRTRKTPRTKPMPSTIAKYTKPTKWSLG